MANDLNKELSIVNNTLKGMNTNLNSIRKNLYDISRQLRIMNSHNIFNEQNYNMTIEDTSNEYNGTYDTIEDDSVNEEVSADGGNSDAQ